MSGRGDKDAEHVMKLLGAVTAVRAFDRRSTRASDR